MSWNRMPARRMNLRDIEQGAARYLELKGRINGEQADGAGEPCMWCDGPLDPDDMCVDGCDDSRLDPPDCRICADEITWCESCDPDHYRDKRLDR